MGGIVRRKIDYILARDCQQLKFIFCFLPKICHKNIFNSILQLVYNWMTFHFS